jgi:hypothetical protein
MFHTQQPAFSTLNLDVIPDKEYVSKLEAYQPKFDTDMLKELLKQTGLQSSDERVYKMISVMMEDKLCSII